MAIRITESRLKRYAIASGLILAGIPLGFVLISLMIDEEVIEVLHFTGDQVCGDICTANITFKVNEDIFLYPFNESWAFTTNNDAAIELISVNRTWGKGTRNINTSKKCTGTWCGKNPTDTRAEAEFVYAFREGKTYTLVYTVKKDSKADIKWSWHGDLVDPVMEGERTTDDIFTKLEFNEKDGEAIFKMYSPSNLPKENLQVDFNIVTGNVSSYDLFIDTTCLRNETVYIDEETCYNRDFTAINGTNITECWNETVPYKTVSTNYTCWKEIDEIPYGEHKYKLQTKVGLKNVRGSFQYSVDWIPTLITLNSSYTQEKWAWFNTSYAFRSVSDCSEVGEGFPGVFNGSGGFTIGEDKQIVWTVCNGTKMALYYNNATDYIIANDAGQLPHEVEVGNGTSFNPTAVWNSSLDIVFHLSHKNDSTRNGYNGTAFNATNISNGAIGGGYDFDATDATMFNTSYPGVAGSAVRTILAFVNLSTNEPNSAFISYGTYTPGAYWDIAEGNADPNYAWVAWHSEWSEFDAPNIDNNNWHLVTYTADGGTSTNDVDFYLDGAGPKARNVTAEAPQTLATGTKHVVHLGFDIENKDYTSLGMDEFRFYNIKLTDADINATYQNYLGTAGFMDAGAQETWGQPTIFNEAWNVSTTTAGNEVQVQTNITILYDGDLIVDTVFFEIEFPNGTRKNFTGEKLQ